MKICTECDGLDGGHTKDCPQLPVVYVTTKMTSKSLDAIRHMAVRLQSILETEKLCNYEIMNIKSAIVNLNEVISLYDNPEV